jgi:ATPase subunit of ABC transporter with duplicated ATPase domains
MTLLAADSVSFSYPDYPRTIVRDFSVSIERGKLVHLQGRNGSGKTTALRLLAGELAPTSGRMVRGRGGRTLYLDQKAAAILAPDLTVNDHLRTFRATHGASAIASELGQFGLPLTSLLSKFAGQLSGGERQIFALLCGLGGSYSILLLDEFTSHLDDQSEAVAYKLLAAALKSKTIGAVVVSHRPVPLGVDEEISLGERDNG